jgi:hypothetical protein
MSRRLQVLLDEPEWREIQRAARAHQMTVAEWVRQALRAPRARTPAASVAKKLDIIRAAARHALPSAGSIDQMLAEIEQGYRGDLPR